MGITCQPYVELVVQNPKLLARVFFSALKDVEHRVFAGETG